MTSLILITSLYIILNAYQKPIQKFRKSLKINETPNS